MYEQQCKDVFAGGVSKSVESLKQFNLDPQQLSFWSSAIYLGADYSWMLLALAKAYNGELQDHNIITDSWDKIKDNSHKFWQDAGSIASTNPNTFFFWSSLHNLTHVYIERSLSNLQSHAKDYDLWHPYGFLSYLSCGLMLSWEFHTVLLKEAETFERVRDIVEDMFKSIASSTNTAYSDLARMRLSILEKYDPFEGQNSYITMYSQSISIKEFRNALFQLCSTEMLRDEYMSHGIDGLLRDLANSNTRFEVIDTRPRKSKGKLPDDINGMKFDD